MANLQHILGYHFQARESGKLLLSSTVRDGVTSFLQRTLEREVRGCQLLIIWTDCDREGENIGFEVIEVCQSSMLSAIFL